jgi:hypothetical protein
LPRNPHFRNQPLLRVLSVFKGWQEKSLRTAKIVKPNRHLLPILIDTKERALRRWEPLPLRRACQQGSWHVSRRPQQARMRNYGT